MRSEGSGQAEALALSRPRRQGLEEKVRPGCGPLRGSGCRLQSVWGRSLHGPFPSLASVLKWSLFSPISGGLGGGATAQRDTPSPERSRGWAEVTPPAVGVEMVAPPVRDPGGHVLPLPGLCYMLGPRMDGRGSEVRLCLDWPPLPQPRTQVSRLSKQRSSPAPHLSLGGSRGNGEALMRLDGPPQASVSPSTPGGCGGAMEKGPGRLW